MGVQSEEISHGRVRKVAAAPELSSPACSLREAADEYMGYAGKDELTAFLNELQEAERAGARGTVVKRVREMLPRVRDDELHARLSEMLDSYEADIGLLNGHAQ